MPVAGYGLAPRNIAPTIPSPWALPTAFFYTLDRGNLFPVRQRFTGEKPPRQHRPAGRVEPRIFRLWPAGTQNGPRLRRKETVSPRGPVRRLAPWGDYNSPGSRPGGFRGGLSPGQASGVGYADHAPPRSGGTCRRLLCSLPFFRQLLSPDGDKWRSRAYISVSSMKHLAPEKVHFNELFSSAKCDVLIYARICALDRSSPRCAAGTEFIAAAKGRFE